MHVRTLFRGEKNVQNWRKEYVFGHVHKIWKGLDGKIKKKAYKLKNMYRSIFIPGKYVLRVCFESPFTRMISSLKYKCWPPSPFHF